MVRKYTKVFLPRATYDKEMIVYLSKKFLVPSDPKSVGRCCLQLAHILCRGSSVIRFLCMSIREQVRHHHGKQRQIDRWMGWTARQMDISVPKCFSNSSILQFKIVSLWIRDNSSTQFNPSHKAKILYLLQHVKVAWSKKLLCIILII